MELLVKYPLDQNTRYLGILVIPDVCLWPSYLSSQNNSI